MPLPSRNHAPAAVGLGAFVAAVILAAGALAQTSPPAFPDNGAFDPPGGQGVLKIGYGIDNYVGSSRIDHRLSAAAGLTYKMNRNVQIEGEVRRERRDSNEIGEDYVALSSCWDCACSNRARSAKIGSANPFQLWLA